MVFKGRKVMIYYEKVELKNGKEMIIRNADYNDGKAVHDLFIETHQQTDYLLTYVDEFIFDELKESFYLERKKESDRAVELLAVIDGKVVGASGIDPIGNKYKIKHRCDFGVSILKEYWGLSIGYLLTEAAIKCAKEMGYSQIELQVVSENSSAIALYKKTGFVEFGRNPQGFISRYGGPQAVILMYKKLD